MTLLVGHRTPGLTHAASGIGQTLTSADLIREKRGGPEWLVDSRLPRCGTSILTGAQNAGKTTLACGLTIAVARGEAWLGFETRRGPVLYVNLDGDLAALRKSFRSAGLVRHDDVHVLDTVRSFDLLARIDAHAKSLGAALVVIDGLRALLHCEQHVSGRPSGAALSHILGLATTRSCHLMLVHDLAGPLAGDLGATMSDAQDEVDTLLMLSRNGEQRVLRTLQREGGDVLNGITVPSRATRAVARAAVGEQLLDYLRRTGRLSTAADISQQIPGVPNGEILVILRELRESGRLIRAGLGTAGDPYRYTGFDRVQEPGKPIWLNRVRPWARVGRDTRARPAHG